MKKLLHLLILLTMMVCASCRSAATEYSASPPVPTVSSNSAVNTATPLPAAPAPNRALTGNQVETAVAEMLAGYRLAGSVRVRGIQELPQQNSAVADLQFEEFEYPVSFEGGLVEAKKFKPRKPSGSAIPPPEEMFPPRKITYSKDGRATLSKYTDGRWVLKSVGWGFDTSVKGNVEIR